MTAYHVEPTSGHIGIKGAVYRFSERFFWKGLNKDVEQMVRNSILSGLFNVLSLLPTVIIIIDTSSFAHSATSPWFTGVSGK